LFEFLILKKVINENRFEIIIYLGPIKEKFMEEKHTDIWFVTIAK